MVKLRKKSFFSLIILLFSIYLFIIGLALGDNVSISDERAKEIYANTLALLGIEIGKETLEISECERYSDFRALIGFTKRVSSKHTVIEIDMQTQKVVWIMNRKLEDAGRSRVQEALHQGEEIKPIRQEAEVIVIAEEYCKRLGHGLASDIKLRAVRFNAKDGSWELGWVRYIGNYLFEEESLCIGIDDLTGKLRVYNNSLTITTKHIVMDVKISRQKAMQIAHTHVMTILPELVMNYKFVISKIGQPELRVVYPNYLNTEKIEKMTDEELLSAARNPRLVYSINFEFRYVGNEKVRIGRPPIDIWVDAITEEVTGGM